MFPRRFFMAAGLLSSLAFAAFAQAPKTPSPDDQYVLGPDSQPKSGVPEGKVTEYEWNNSKIYAGTVRKYWVYVPAQYNKAMAAALDEKGYDHKFVVGEGTHNPKHGASILPDTLRWLWRDYPK